MKIDQAKEECQRWLDYLERQKAKTAAIQQIASDRRSGKCTQDEGKARLRAIDNPSSVTVYDGSRLAEAVAVLMRQ